MIQSVWDRMNTPSKYVMISTWLHIWHDEQKSFLCLINDFDRYESMMWEQLLASSASNLASGVDLKNCPYNVSMQSVQ